MRTSLRRRRQISTGRRARATRRPGKVLTTPRACNTLRGLPGRAASAVSRRGLCPPPPLNFSASPRPERRHTASRVSQREGGTMPDLSILNTLIAMVIVILVLSLIVQSLQTLVKKFFKLKSRTLFNSLVDLFETITRRPDGTAAAGGNSQQKLLAKEVRDKFAEMGRKTLILGRPMLDSIAKGRSE